jgi:diguanylate cyclase (GGDEF)-like protein
MLDARTLCFTLIAVLVVTGIVQLVSSRQNRDEPGLLYWGAANLTAAIGVLVLGLSAEAPQPHIVNLGFAVVLVAYMLNWAGMRRFCRRPAPALAILAPALFWLAANRVPLLQVIEWRLALSAAMTMACTIATAATLLSFRSENLFARKPMIAWLLIHAALLAIRIPVALTLPASDGAAVFASDTMTIGLFGAVIHVVLISFLQISLTKGRADNRYRHAAETDMLTGIPNRRAVFERAEPMIAAAVRSGRPASVLVIDIDRFKGINDSLGHAGGDAVITAVARAIADHLRPTDICGRLGGEEFGCVLPDTPLPMATAMAEELRARIAVLDPHFAGTAVKVSASIGLAVSGSGPCTFGKLLAEADAGLYQAKRTGRDRVVAMDLEFREAG